MTEIPSYTLKKVYDDMLIRLDTIYRNATDRQTELLHRYLASARTYNKSTTCQYVSSMMLDIPRTTTSLGDRAFAVAGPRAWNSLPLAIRDPSLSPPIF